MPPCVGQADQLQTPIHHHATYVPRWVSMLLLKREHRHQIASRLGLRYRGHANPPTSRLDDRASSACGHLSACSDLSISWFEARARCGGRCCSEALFSAAWLAMSAEQPVLEAPCQQVCLAAHRQSELRSLLRHPCQWWPVCEIALRRVSFTTYLTIFSEARSVRLAVHFDRCIDCFVCMRRRMFSVFHGSKIPISSKSGCPSAPGGQS